MVSTEGGARDVCDGVGLVDRSGVGVEGVVCMLYLFFDFFFFFKQKTAYEILA